MHKKVVLIKRVDVVSTLKEIAQGDSRIIPTAEIKTNSIRSAVRRLNKKNPNSFSATEEGLINEVKVTRNY